GSNTLIQQHDWLPEQAHEQGMQWAAELATTTASLPTWQATFRLARRLRQLTPNYPEQFEKVVAHYCELTGRDFQPFFLDFVVVWDKVKTAAGDDVLTWSFNMAEKCPYRPFPCVSPMYGTVAGMAWHLWTFREGKPFWLPRPKVAILLEATQMTV